MVEYAFFHSYETTMLIFPYVHRNWETNRKSEVTKPCTE
jgi:hypothetical protein